MAIINPTLPNDGENADAADLTIPILAILAVINGGIDATNLADSAVTTAKVADGAVTDVKLADSAAGGWKSIATTPTTVTPLGQKSYTVLFPAATLTDRLTKGMRMRFTRTTAAPTQCTLLNGSTQYYSKTSPAGMTFTDDFVVSAWIKLTSYPANIATIASRYNGTSGWIFFILPSGQLALQGINAGAANTSDVRSYQAIPLNKWVHVTSQLDMSTFTATTTTSYIMIDGVDVPAFVSRTGTNPTALIQAGNLEIGAENGGAATTFFPGKIAQVAIYSAKVTQATMLAAMNQTLSGSETNLISGYSFNGIITDLNTSNANNLTAQASAVATNADSPFAQAATAGLYEYGIVTNVTDTTLTIQVPEGSALPSSGGISAASYSGLGVPYGFPKQRTKWQLQSIFKAAITLGASGSTWYSGASVGIGITSIQAPLGEWAASYRGSLYADAGSTADSVRLATLSTSATTETDTLATTYARVGTTSANSFLSAMLSATRDISPSVLTPYYVLGQFSGTTGNAVWSDASSPLLITLDNAYL